jgi:hypothetical protein
MDLFEALLIDSGAFFLFGGASGVTRSTSARLSSRRKTASPILQAKGSERNYFLQCPGLQRFSAGLPFANRVVLMAVWLGN